MTEGVTGFLVDSMDDAVAATRRAINLSPPRCRAAFEQRFTADRMARDYVAVYDGHCRIPTADAMTPAAQGV